MYIMIYLFEDINRFSDDNYYKFCSLLSNDRKKRIDNYHFIADKKLGLIVYLLLLIGLELDYGICEKQEFGFGRLKKPFLKNHSHIQFNFSHCIKSAACAINTTSVGVDVQDYITWDEDLINMVCSRGEKELANTQENLFTRYWVLKESYLKFKGIGLIKNLASLDFSDCKGQNFTKYGLIFGVHQFDNYLMAVCSTNKIDFKIITYEELLFRAEKYLQFF